MIRCRIIREWVLPVATADFSDGMRNLHCGLTLEDEFVLTRIRAKAKSLNNRSDRDQFFWVMILKLMCKERAYKTVMQQIGVAVETNVQMFDDSEDSVE